MNPMHKVSAAVLIAAISVLPASGVFAAQAAAVKVAPQASAMAVTAAQAPAKIVPPHATTTPVAATTEVAPAGMLKGMIGKWNKSELAHLARVKSVQVFDAKSVYTPADLKIIEDARAANATNLGKFHAAINADGRLKARLAKNKIDVNSIIGVSVNKDAAKIYLG